MVSTRHQSNLSPPPSPGSANHKADKSTDISANFEVSPSNVSMRSAKGAGVAEFKSMVLTRQQSNMANFAPATAVEVTENRKIILTGSYNQSDNVLVFKNPKVLLDLPIEVIHKVLSNVSFHDIAVMRQVCKFMNETCGNLLTTTFYKLIAEMMQRQQKIKQRMPRRESARREHPLACECDIIETIHMRLSLLQSTFGKHIDRKFLHFFPGAILDEVYRILYYIKITPRLSRPYRVTDELFDLTTMAMEYFREKLECRLPSVTSFGFSFTPSLLVGSRGIYFPPMLPQKPGCSYTDAVGLEDAAVQSSSDMEDDELPQSNMVLRNRISTIKKGMKAYNTQMAYTRKEMKVQKMKINKMKKSQKQYDARQREMENKYSGLWHAFEGMMQEFSKVKAEMQYLSSRGGGSMVCSACGNAAAVATAPFNQIQENQNDGVENSDQGAVENVVLDTEQAGGHKDESNIEAMMMAFMKKPDQGKSDTFWEDVAGPSGVTKISHLCKDVPKEGENSRGRVKRKRSLVGNQRNVLKLRSKTVKIDMQAKRQCNSSN